MTLYTGGFTTPGTSAEINLVLDVDLTSQSVTNNTSTLSWSFYMQEYVNAGPYNLNPSSTASATVGSLVYSSTNRTYDFRATNATVSIASGSTTVTHNADGSKSITIAGSYNGGSPIGTASFSTTLVLPVIPRNRVIVGDGGSWETAEVYVGINGAWTPVQPYVGSGGTYKLLNSTP